MQELSNHCSTAYLIKLTACQIFTNNLSRNEAINLQVLNFSNRKKREMLLTVCFKRVDNIFYLCGDFDFI